MARVHVAPPSSGHTSPLSRFVHQTSTDLRWERGSAESGPSHKFMKLDGDASEDCVVLALHWSFATFVVAQILYALGVRPHGTHKTRWRSTNTRLKSTSTQKRHSRLQGRHNRESKDAFHSLFHTPTKEKTRSERRLLHYSPEGKIPTLLHLLRTRARKNKTSRNCSTNRLNVLDSL